MFNVIIVDDEPMIREGLQSLIAWEDLGFRVVAIAKDGREALQKYKQFRPDLMIVDIRMPVMDGLQLIETLRKDDQHIHFIILSGYADFDYARRAMSINVEGYLLKPVDEDELSDYIQHVKAKLDKKSTMNEDSPEWLSDIKCWREKFETTTAPLKIDLNGLSEKLYYAMDIGDGERVKKMVDELAELLIAHQAPERAIKTYYVQYITMALNKITQRDPTLLSLNKQYTVQLMSIYEQSTFTAMQQFVYDLLSGIISQIERESPETTMKKMLDFIHRNYDENIKLETCAELFNYNRVYLGQMFKNYTGELFNTYLDKVRIERAKELLSQDLKVYQISRRVGYRDVDYFHGKFKRYVGLTPLEYREQLNGPHT